MLNQSNDKIISSFETDLYKIIKLEIDSIKFNISMQKYMESTVLSMSDNLWNKTNSSSDIDLIHCASKDLYNISNFCFQLQSNIKCLEILKSKLEALELTKKIEPDNDFYNKLNNYREECLKLINESANFSFLFNNFITNFPEVKSLPYTENKISNKEQISTTSTNTIVDSTENTNTDTNITINKDNNNGKDKDKNKNKNKNKDKKEKESEVNKANKTNETNIEKIDDTSKKVLYIPNNLKEDTLIISNTEVILPFNKNDLEEKLKNSNLTSYKEVINTFYKKSVKSFEPSAISRFREAYSLIINKEHGSKFQAISLGLELSTNYNLHPAIIAACKNLTQLDVYLSCLEYNELSDFHFFDIVYNIPPAPKKHLFKKFLEE